MQYVLLLWGALSGAYGVIVMVASRTTIEEVEAGIAFLIATVAIGCAGIIDTLKARRKEAKGVEAASLAEPFYK